MTRLARVLMRLSGVWRDPAAPLTLQEGRQKLGKTRLPLPGHSLCRTLCRGRVADQAAGHAALAFVNQSPPVVLDAPRNDGMARGSLAGPRSGMRRSMHVFVTSVAARIRALYDSLPEATKAMPVVSPTLANDQSIFSGADLRHVVRVSLTSGWGDLCRTDLISLAAMLRKMEVAPAGDDDGEFSSTFATNNYLVTGIRKEQNKVLAVLQWKEAPIEVNSRMYQFFNRDLVDVGVAALLGASELDLDGGALPQTLDGQRRRSGTLNAGMFVTEAAKITRLHGVTVRMLSVSLHADEALVSWSGAHYIFTIRAHFPSAVGSGWVTVGYIPHVQKALFHTDVARLAVSDARNDLLQRCLAVVMRRFIRASEVGFPVVFADHGRILLVPRVGGLVVDQPPERALYALMGHMCAQFFSPCTVHRKVSCSPEAEAAPPRAVIASLEAQIAAADVRLSDPRASRRLPLAEAHSALPFVPILGAMHSFSTGDLLFYRIVSLDVLHVSKLGVLRLLAQRVPIFLRAVCTPEAGSIMVDTTNSLDVLNLRAFELWRLCRSSPASPGYALARLAVFVSFSFRGN